MKRMMAWILALMLALTALSGAALADGRVHTIEIVDYPLYVGSMDVEATMKLYFLDGVKDLPYVELNDWMDLVTFYIAQVLEKPDYSLTLQTAGPIAVYTRENGFSMVIDFDSNTFRYEDFNYFMRLPGSSSLLDFTSISCFNEAGEPTLLKKSDEDSFDRYGDVLVISLQDYGIDIIEQDGLYLAPLQTMNDFMLAPNTMCNCFFNGQCLILGSQLGDAADIYYSAPTGQRSEALAKYGYSELCLMLDRLYGLKDVHDISSFAQLFYEIGFDEPLSGTDPATADKAIYYVINQYLDDIHSAFINFSYLTGQIDFKADNGPSKAALIEHYTTNLLARQAAYPDGVPTYEEVGNTAYITFDQFTIEAETPDDYYSYENPEDIPFDDTFAMVIKAHAKINRENSPIENVVIDLSCNTGGAVDTAAYLIAWFLGKASISLKDNITGAMSNTEYWADTNLDRVFDESDTLAGKNLYCLISPVSFSCGNLTPNVFKQSGKVTLLGRTSGGGSCTVQNVSSAWGTSFQISAPNRMSFLKNGALYDIDHGADPDYTISRPEKFYDRMALTDYINSLF